MQGPGFGSSLAWRGGGGWLVLDLTKAFCCRVLVLVQDSNVLYQADLSVFISRYVVSVLFDLRRWFWSWCLPAIEARVGMPNSERTSLQEVRELDRGANQVKPWVHAIPCEIPISDRNRGDSVRSRSRRGRRTCATRITQQAHGQTCM